MEVQYIDRATGRIEIEKIYGHKALSLLYGDSFASQIFSFLLLPLFSRIPWVSKFYGWLQKRRSSAKRIAPFIQAYGVDTSEFEEAQFASFNDFFIRKLKKSARLIDSDPKRAVLPADGRYLVFPDLPNVKRFYMKEQPFDLATFLQNEAYSRRFAEGSMVIARLCPTDYHRFHFPVDGTPGIATAIPGPLFSVNPVALRKRLSILWENKRMITEIETERFGTVLYVEIGATCVGTICQTYTPDQRVRKGDEKGYFSFGGSCLALLFERGRIQFDADFVANSEKGLETKANMGQSLGLQG